MYTIDREGSPRKPVIASQLSADHAAKRWIEENNLQAIPDASGMPWTLAISAKEIPSATNHREIIWQIQMQCFCTLNAQSLIDTHVFDKDKDQRMLALMGDSEVPIYMKPIRWEVRSAEEARVSIIDHALALKQKWAGETLTEIKRQLVFRHVDERGRFPLPKT